MTIKRILAGRDHDVPVKIWTEDVDSASMDQLTNIARMPFIHKHVAAMPDVHLGKGATVGSVIPTKGAIIPASVGVDIGCGMNAVRTSLTANDLPDSLRTLREQIEKAVPVGFNQHPTNNAFHGVYATHLSRDFDRISSKHPKILGKKPEKAICQLGTLGGGNHFIEICLDEEDRVWIMLHSGSRGIGNQIGTYFIEQARELMQRMFINLPDRDLAYLPQGEGLFDDYIEALNWAQEYARLNREQMMRLIVGVMADMFGPKFQTTVEAINCHHNYVEKENHYGANVYVTRKGAIRAREGDLGIIPGSMGALSYIVRGKGNPESFNSCAHGAGRRMSRNQARKVFDAQALSSQTEGVECRKDKDVVDEAPGAYKDIDEVMGNQSDLVDVVHILKQVVCVKG